MRSIFCLVFIICFALKVIGQQKVDIKDNEPFWYVYTDFQKDWSQVSKGIESFQQEFQKQGIQSQISGPLLLIVFDDDPPYWGIGYPVKEKIPVKLPLKISSYNYDKIVETTYLGIPAPSKIAYAFLEMDLYLEEKGFERAGPIILKYLNFQKNVDPKDYETKLILPVNERTKNAIIIKSLYNYVLTIASFLYLFFSVFLFFHKKGKRLGNKILAVFLLSYALILINWLIYSFRYYLIQPFPHLFEVFSSFGFLIPPFLFLYVQSHIYPNFTFKKIHLLHLVPFFIDILFLTVNFHILNPELKRQVLLSRSIFTDFESLIHSLTSEIQNLSYIIAALFILKRYRKRIKQYFSNVERINLSWLNIVLFGYMAIELIGIIKHNIHFFTGIYIEILGIMLILGFLGLAMVVVYKGLQQPKIFLDMPIINNKAKYTKSKLADEHKEQYLEKLMKYMESEKPYMDPLINLRKMAERIKISPHYLSQILNECLEQNFFDFINSYRIKECKKMLEDSCQDHKTVLEILYESGFNSKSVFNTYFLKFTGLTPTQYRKLHNN